MDYELMNKIELLFDFALDTLKNDYGFLIFFVLLSIGLTVLVNKMKFFKRDSEEKVKLKGKSLTIFGVWLMPIFAFAVRFSIRVYMWIYKTPMYSWLATAIRLFPIFCIVITVLVIFWGIRTVSKGQAKQPKVYIPTIDDTRNEIETKNDDIKLF